MEIIAAFQNGHAFLWYHPESDSHYIDYEENATDGLAEQIADIYLEGRNMRVHYPELYEAHRARDEAFLRQLASQLGLTYDQFEASNWDNEGKVRDMPRGRPKANKPTQAEFLVQALSFVSVASGDEEYSSFVQLKDKQATCFNGQIAAGHPIYEELNACPHLERLKIALKRAGNSLAIAETPTGQLSLKGDKLRVLVPCYEGERPAMEPDASVAVIDDRIKQAFAVCGTLANENAADVLCASLLLEANQCTGTNRAAMLQFWHGIDLPPHMVLPKVFTAAVAKCAYKLVGFGLTWSNQLGAPSAVTIWFENGAWIKTQCYNDRWPNVSHIMDAPNFPIETPAGLFDAIEAVYHFNDNDNVYFFDNLVQSHESGDVGAQYDVQGLQGGKAFDGELIGQVAPWAKMIDLTTAPDRAFFMCNEPETPVRGVLMAKGPTNNG